MALVDLTKIAQIAAIDVHGNWGYVVWDDTAFLHVDAGFGAGVIGHGGKTYAITAANPAAVVKAAPPPPPPPLSADAPYQPDASYNPNSP